MEDIILRIDKDGKLAKYEPYAEIDIMTKEEFELFEEAILLADAVRKAFKTGFAFEMNGKTPISSKEELIEWFKA